MKFILFVACLLSVTFTINTPGQDSLCNKSVFVEGITIEFGQGLYSVKDEYISKEKYSGTIPHLGLRWTKYHDDYGYTLGFEYQNSSDIKNNNVSANIYQFSLNQGFLYSMPKFSFISNDAYTFLGPSTDLYFFYNKQNIAISGFNYASSFAFLFSVGVNSEFILPLSENLFVESSIGFSVLSLGFRMVNDEDEDEEAPAKLLTLFAGTNGSFKLGARYFIMENLSLKIAYRFQLVRISSWTPLISASDNLIIAVSYGF